MLVKKNTDENFFFFVRVIPLGKYSPCLNRVCEFRGSSGTKNLETNFTGSYFISRSVMWKELNQHYTSPSVRKSTLSQVIKGTLYDCTSKAKYELICVITKNQSNCNLLGFCSVLAQSQSFNFLCLAEQDIKF